MSDSLLTLTAQIVAAHISKNTVDAGAMPDLIQTVYRSLSSAGTTPDPVVAVSPAVPIKKSVFSDYIICLEDGKKLKMLKRHLKTSYNMTPVEYRAKWNLPSEYPMVAPSYATHRSALAKKIGLGRKPTTKASESEPQVTVLPAKRAKGSKG